MQKSSIQQHDNEGPFTPASLGSPWGDRPSIFSHIVRCIDPSTGRLVPAGKELPDESRIDPNDLRFVAGAFDGIMSQGLGDTEDSSLSGVVYKQLVRAVHERDPQAFNVLHGYLVEHAARSYIDELNPLIAASMDEIGSEVAALGRHLLKNAADREVVKFAINLIGVCGDKTDHVDLMTIGSHDEFTLFAVVALGHSGGDIRSTWELAKRVEGWGRIQCVERLDIDFVDADIKAWLLREGYKTSIMTEYTAPICARRGELAHALESTVLDRALIDGAADILSALSRGNPGDGMKGYAQSEYASERFLAIVETHETPSAD